MHRQTRNWRPTLLGGLLMAILTAAAANPSGTLQGQWSGDQVRLVIDVQGGRMVTGCADGSFSGPLALAADGSFGVDGVFEHHPPGPQRADAEAPHAQARFSGEVREGRMTLRILPVGAGQALIFTLREGQGAKIVRCR